MSLLLFSFEGMKDRYILCLDSSMVEHAAVNRGVAGSSPARGAQVRQGDYSAALFFLFTMSLPANIYLSLRA